MNARFLFPAILSGLLPFLAAARPVSESEAVAAAANWLGRNPRPLGERLSAALAAEMKVRATCDESGGALFYVVRPPDGGMVVTSAETGVEPVVAFSDADMQMDAEDHPLFAILVADLTSRTEQVRSSRAGKRAASPDNEDSPSDAEAAWASLLSGKRFVRFRRPMRGRRKVVLRLRSGDVHGLGTERVGDGRVLP